MPNILRLSLHPDGLAPRIRNWRDRMLARVAAQVEAVADPVLVALLTELRS